MLRDGQCVRLLIAVCLAACGSSAGAPDAGVVDAGAIAAPAPPASPAPPVFTPCPAGWREVAGDVTTCDPYPAAGASTCAVAGDAQFPGEAACGPIGAACPAGDWPVDLPATGVLYVQAGAVGGDGSPAAPFGAIADAMAAASAGTVVALAKGLYDEPVQLRNGVTLQGACVDATIVSASAASDAEPVVKALGITGAVVKDVTITGAREGIFQLGGTLTLAGVLVRDVDSYGVFARAGTLTATRLVVRDVHSRPSDLTLGRGVHVDGAAQVSLTGAIVERTHEVGVYVLGMGTNCALADAVVRDTASRASASDLGVGVVAIGQGHVALTRGLVERNRYFGLLAQGMGTMTLTDAIVRDTGPRELDGISGQGLVALDHAAVDGAHLLVERNRAAGMVATQDATLTLTDVVVRGTLPKLSNGAGGRGLVVDMGARADVMRAWFEDNRDVGVVVGNVGSVATLTDLVVEDTTAATSGTNGEGVFVALGGRAEVTRARLERNGEVGAAAKDPGTVLLLDDVVVSDTRSRLVDLFGGEGVVVSLGAQATAHRLLLEGNREGAFAASDTGTVVTITDLVARDTGAREADGTRGRGIAFQLGASGDVTRALFEGNRDVGVFAYNPGTRLVLRDLVVRDTLPQECAAAQTCGWDLATNLGAYDGASVEVFGFELRRAARCGVQLATGGTVDLHQGVVADSPIGANVQTADFDVARLQDGVVFQDNEINLDATALPVPAP